MAYLKDISPPACYRCKRPATKQLFNTYNASLGDYCTPHARQALDEQQRTERRELDQHGAVLRTDR